MAQNIPVDKPRPEVLIIGAGIGGLVLAILLEQINIPYRVFERASEVKQLGSAIAFTSGTVPALEQLGIYEELRKVSKPYTDVKFFDGANQKLGSYNSDYPETGYLNQIFGRPKFYDVLRSRVSKQKINFKKKVTGIEEKEGKIIIHCSDDTSYTGDILYVRQNMYKQMDEKGCLPKSDLEDFLISYITVVGVATPLNPDKYPQLKDENSSFNQIIYGDGANCYVLTLPNNQISWGFGIQLTETDVRHLKSQDAEWSPEANDATLSKYTDFPCPLGGTMGDIFDATPKDLISKAFLEEKIFKT
ncbi:hypothetical protein BGZ46_000469 [Entomortierella lignicola]|nr:hypothetical protein BGZ46_000469 [Entomortierella lignicola]